MYNLRMSCTVYILCIIKYWNVHSSNDARVNDTHTDTHTLCLQVIQHEQDMEDNVKSCKHKSI